MTPHPIAIIGGGLTGLTCAIRLAEQGYQVHLFEAAPNLGGRTKSFYSPVVDHWVDHGPHLLIGAYQATQKLLHDVGASSNVTWQPSLHLPLWDKQRSFFSLKPKPYLPFPVALLISLMQLPTHGFKSVRSMLKIALNMKKPPAKSVQVWMEQLNISSALQRDLIEPLCLGAMNEPMHRADCKSFARVLNEAFANHHNARLGWFNQPISQAFIDPLKSHLKNLGISIFTSTTIRDIEQNNGICTLNTGTSQTKPYSTAIIALPAYARNRLLGIRQDVKTEAITNVHLWFETDITLPQALIGSIGTYSQWFFDVSSQTGQKGLSHICAVISAETPINRKQSFKKVCTELGALLQMELPAPVYHKIICEQRATVLTSYENQTLSSGTILDASEAPRPGDLPATIESAILRGEEAAKTLCFQQK